MELRVFEVEMRGFWCGTEGGGGFEGFLVLNCGVLGLNRGVFGVEPRGFRCGTAGFSVLN